MPLDKKDGDAPNLPGSPDSSREIMKALLSPYSIGQLKKAIAHMNDDILVFRFAYGNEHGHSDWKRTDTWKQWLRKRKDAVRNNQKENA